MVQAIFPALPNNFFNISTYWRTYTPILADNIGILICPSGSGRGPYSNDAIYLFIYLSIYLSIYLLIRGAYAIQLFSCCSLLSFSCCGRSRRFVSASYNTQPAVMICQSILLFSLFAIFFVSPCKRCLGRDPRLPGVFLFLSVLWTASFAHKLTRTTFLVCFS